VDFIVRGARRRTRLHTLGRDLFGPADACG
jgi:hypothetical protein